MDSSSKCWPQKGCDRQHGGSRATWEITAMHIMFGTSALPVVVMVVVLVVVSYASDDRRASIEQPRILRQPKPKGPLAKSPRITRINIAVLLNLKYTGKYRWFLMSHKKIY